RRDRPVGLVRSEALPLTRSPATLRHDLLAIIHAGIAAVDAHALVARALADDSGVGQPFRAAGAGRPAGVRYACIAAGKAAVPMARAAADCVDVGAGLVVAPDAAPLPDRFEMIVGGHPVPTPASEAAGRRALA